MTLIVTHHAINRYRQRVAAVSEDEARSALSAPVFYVAARFGDCAVLMAGGHRAIIKNNSVITVLPPLRKGKHK